MGCPTPSLQSQESSSLSKFSPFYLHALVIFPSLENLPLTWHLWETIKEWKNLYMRWQTPSWNQEQIECPICVKSFRFCLFENLLSWLGHSWVFFDYLELSSKWPWDFVQIRWTPLDVPHVCSTHVHVCGTHKAIFHNFLKILPLFFCLSFFPPKMSLRTHISNDLQAKSKNLFYIIILNRNITNAW